MSHLRTIIVRAARSGGIATAIIRRGVPGDAHVGGTAPASPRNGQFWFNNTTSILSIWLTSPGQWVALMSGSSGDNPLFNTDDTPLLNTDDTPILNT